MKFRISKVEKWYRKPPLDDFRIPVLGEGGI